MSPERLLREPWRLALFFTAVFGLMIFCIAVILFQQERFGAKQSAANHMLSVAIQKSDRNNETTRKVFAAGEKARGQLIAMVAEEKRMNECLIKMNRRLLASQNWMRLHMKHLEMRRR